MKSLISVIVPVYNVENFLVQCIESLINQSYKNLEIILVNDGSPDNCGEICDTFAQNDSRIKVIHQENMGLSGARNTGLKQSKGAYIAFVDSDDWVEPEMFEVMHNLLIKHDLDVLECDANKTKSNSQVRDKPFKYELKFENSLQALNRIIYNSGFAVWRRIYKKDIIGNSSFLLNLTSEDIYFTIDNIQKINRLGYINAPFYNYRLNNTNSITKSGYSLKRLNDTLNGSFYIQNQLSKIKDNNLQRTIKIHMLFKLIMHYKQLNYNNYLDLDYKQRRYIKDLIKDNYNVKSSKSLELKLARYLPIKLFYIFIKLNLVKHRLFHRDSPFI